MKRFLINMAIVNVNRDEEKRTLIDNYIPLLSYALQKYPHNTIALEDLKICFRKHVDFSMPVSALITLLKRAAKLALLERKKEGQYEIIREKLNDQNKYTRVREQQEERYNNLKNTFQNYYKDSLDIKKEEIDQYFFETLYELAPSLINSVPSLQNIGSKERKRKSYKYLVSKFIQYAQQEDTECFESITSFVQGAMLTETFYYQTPEGGKFLSQVKVFFDTQFIIKALGYCERIEAEPRRELVDMLKELSVSMRIFEDTYKEICNIFDFQIENLLKRGRLKSNHPGDVADYFIRNNSKLSDIQLKRNKLEERLRAKGIKVEKRPLIKNQLAIKEQKLADFFKREFSKQSESSRNHDIDCLSAIHQLRNGENKRFINSCNAIFIVTNPRLVRLAGSFFKQEYGRSDIPVCMGDYVFTTLIWLRFAKKIPNLPKEQIVANCYAATTPSSELWDKYCQEAEQLANQGDLTEEDYVLLTHSLEARSCLMEINLGEDELIEGTVEQVLAKAKERYAKGLVKTKLDAERQQYQSNLDAERQQHQSKLDAKHQQYQSNLEAERQQHQSKLDAERQQHQSKLDAERQQHQSKLDAERQQHQSNLDAAIRHERREQYSKIVGWVLLILLAGIILILDVWVLFHIPTKLWSWDTLLPVFSAIITIVGIKDWSFCKKQTRLFANCIVNKIMIKKVK